MRRLIFQDLPTKHLLILWLSATVVAVTSVVASKRVDDWAHPGDFVEVCSDSVPDMPAPSAGLGARIEALDAMIACTERMEVQYVERGRAAAQTSVAAYSLVALLFSVAIVATWRSVGGGRTS